MFKTKDFGLAALLVANNIKLTNYTTDELGQMWFEFLDDATTRELEHSFNLATAMVNVQKFTAASKMLKALIYQNRKNIYEHKLGKLNYNTIR
ncbi:MAG: hypothetical protein IPP40_07225 [bacterium]|nr:hypothetical protein [bacterium]